MADFATKTGVSGTVVPNTYDSTPALTDRVPITGGKETTIGDILDLGYASTASEATFNQVGAGSAARTFASKLKDAVSVLDWIPEAEHAAIQDQTSSYNCVTAIQAAFDEAPEFGTLIFPSGLYQLDGKVTLTRHINILGVGGILKGVFGANTTDSLIDINIAGSSLTGVSGGSRDWFTEGLTAFFLTGGRSVLRLLEPSAGVGGIGYKILNNRLSTLAASPGWAIEVVGTTGLHWLVIEGNDIENGIKYAGADGTIIEKNLIYGQRCAVTLDLVEGGFKTKVCDNALVSRDGAVYVVNGSQIDIERNQCEQNGTNASPYSAIITIAPTSYGSRNIRIVGNNLGGGPETNIHIESLCEDCVIDENTFGLTGSGYDVKLVQSSVKWTRIGRRNTVRGTRAGIDPAFPVSVYDIGTGTYGVKKLGSDLSLVNGWSAASNFFFWKDENDIVHLNGVLVGSSSLNAGVTIGTFPVGFRALSFLAPPAFVDAGLIYVGTSETGVLVLGPTIATTNLYLGSTSWPVIGRTSYSPGV